MESNASASFGGDNHGLQIGNNHGLIHAEFRPPERPETPPRPLSTVPFPRDPDFVHRDPLVDQINNKRSVPGSRTALVGLGGVGKSQLAIEYSYIVRSKSPATWVLWVHASNEARFEQSFQNIADQIKLSRRRDPRFNIFQIVENWLLDERNGKWICILDNVDDEFLCSSNAGINTQTKPLLEYIPRSPHGSTLITSRSRDLALRMVDYKGLIEVKPMRRSEALDLFQRKIGQPGDSTQGARNLVEALEFMPLAIVQAACYIQHRAPRYSVSQYLDDFQSDREATKLLGIEREAGHLYRDWEAKNSILVTWQISFEYIRRTRPSAADLLSLMSFFDRQGIPESLVRYQSKSNDISTCTDIHSDTSDEESSESDVGPDFEDDVAMLRDYSFIYISGDSTLFTMHRLVQLSTLAWLKSYHDARSVQWREIFINNLSREFPTGSYKNWAQCRLLYPHVKYAMAQRPKAPESLLKKAALLHNAVWYALESGMFGVIDEMASESRKQRMKLLGHNHEASLESTAMLALVYRKQGRWKESEQMFEQVMETRKTELGENHLSTLESMHELAVTYQNQGRWEEAEWLFLQVIETYNSIGLCEDHPFTLVSMHELALTYQKQYRWEEAEQLNVQVMEACKIKLGEDHPETLASIHHLALTYRNQGRQEDAEKLFKNVIETSKTKLSEDHPSTLSCIHNLALTYLQQGRWEEAEQLNVQVMKARKMKLGEDHPDTLAGMHNLALTYQKQGRREEAKQLFEQVVETSERKLGGDHPSTLMAMANLAFTRKSLGQSTEAINLLRHCLAKRKEKLGIDHPLTLSSSRLLLVWEGDN
ncbi:hypothetical protein N7456_006732 [Penicillium angulare]|uniref:NB-ARC domain-containing protein n=1 Tax=Penicillium angulare TaxID=116970 RepID=A0A9W9KBY1_9EURO|nr:hypothetical protein N7456_006732 [Penicillium angulare]